jgi:hypothetical protein
MADNAHGFDVKEIRTGREDRVSPKKKMEVTWNWRKSTSIVLITHASRGLEEPFFQLVVLSSRLGKKSIASSDMSCRWQR